MDHRRTNLNLDLNDQEGEHLKDSSETTIFTTIKDPLRSETGTIPDFLYEICTKQEMRNEFLRSIKSQTNSIKSYAQSDIISSPTSTSFKRMQYYKSNLDLHSQQKLDKYRGMMENLGEEEFVKFLQAYRQAKNVPAPKRSSSSYKGSMNDFKSPGSSNDDKISTVTQDEVVNEHSKFMNLQTQCLSLENSYLPLNKANTQKKVPNFYVNYISSKMHVKNEPHSLTAIMNNIISDRKDNGLYPTTQSNVPTSQSYTKSRSINETKKARNEKRFRPPMKILNFPAFA